MALIPINDHNTAALIHAKNYNILMQRITDTEHVKSNAGNIAIGILANYYSSSRTYTAGDYVLYEGSLYKCTDTTSGAFDSAKWTESVAMDKISVLEGVVEPLKNNVESLNSYWEVIETTNTSLTLKENCAYFIENEPASLNITLPLSLQNRENEYKVRFFASENFSLTITVPNGYTVLGLPENYVPGALYELSLLKLSNNLIGCIAHEWIV